MSKTNETSQGQPPAKPADTGSTQSKTTSVDRAEVERLLRQNDEATLRFSRSVSTGEAAVRQK